MQLIKENSFKYVSSIVWKYKPKDLLTQKTYLKKLFVLMDDTYIFFLFVKDGEAAENAVHC